MFVNSTQLENLFLPRSDCLELVIKSLLNPIASHTNQFQNSLCFDIPFSASSFTILSSWSSGIPDFAIAWAIDNLLTECDANRSNAVWIPQSDIDFMTDICLSESNGIISIHLDIRSMILPLNSPLSLRVLIICQSIFSDLRMPIDIILSMISWLMICSNHLLFER